MNRKSTIKKSVGSAIHIIIIIMVVLSFVSCELQLPDHLSAPILKKKTPTSS